MPRNCCLLATVLILAGCQCCPPSAAPDPGRSEERLGLEHTQSPSQTVIGSPLTLVVKADQDVAWNLPTLPDGWASKQSERELELKGPTPLGSTRNGPHLTIAASAIGSEEEVVDYPITVNARQNNIPAQVREEGRRVVGSTTLIFYTVSIPDRPVRWPDRPGRWQLKFDTRGLGPSDSIEVSDNEDDWEGTKQTFPPHALISKLNDQGGDAAEAFDFYQSPAINAILDGQVSVTVQLQTDRLDDFAVAETVLLTLW
ncbi:MAG: hypothetical protein ACIAS6_01300 [Phycisphaerales bacterium JB060]